MTGGTPGDADDGRLPRPRGAAPLDAAFASVGGPKAAFAPKVADYAASRPGYPVHLFERLEAIGALGPAALVADLGSGTGLLSRGLLPRSAGVFAVEPNAGMRAAAEASLGHVAGFHSVAGSAEATTLQSGTLDLVAAAQAFHWFDLEATRLECLRILRPGGVVALIRNDRRLADALHAELENVLAAFGGARREALRDVEDPARIEELFGGPPRHAWEIPNEQLLTLDGLLGLVFSRSYMPQRGTPAGRAASLRVAAAFEAAAADGAVQVRYTTRVAVGRPAESAPADGVARPTASGGS